MDERQTHQQGNPGFSSRLALRLHIYASYFGASKKGKRKVI